MFRLHLGDYNSQFANLRNFMERVVRAQWAYEAGEYVCLTEEQATELGALLTLFEGACMKVEFSRPLERVPKVRLIVENPSKHDLVAVKWELKELLEAAVTETHEKKFFVLSEYGTKHFNLKHPFGEIVYIAFESSRFDVAEAWKCYGLGRYTACVFHCMRVLEKGLHALSNDLNAKFGTSIVFKKGIEFQNWGVLIGKIEKEIGKLLDPNRQPPVSQADLGFYSKAVKEFFYFKVGWRDDSAHSRSSYNEKEAKLVLDHVDAFMRHLAKAGLKDVP